MRTILNEPRNVSEGDVDHDRDNVSAADYLLVAGAASRDISLARPDTETGQSVLGGPFTMVSHEGQTVTDQELRGRRVADVHRLHELPRHLPHHPCETSWFDALGAEADDLRSFLVTVDPDRDSPSEK